MAYIGVQHALNEAHGLLAVDSCISLSWYLYIFSAAAMGNDKLERFVRL